TRLVVWRRHGPDALLRQCRGRDPLSPYLPRSAGAVWRRRPRALQEMVRRLFLSQAQEGAARRRRHLLRRPERRRLRALSLADAKRRRSFPRRLRADPRTAIRHALRRAGTGLPAVPPRPLRRIQSGMGSRHVVRPAVEWPRRSHIDVDAPAGALALRLAARARVAGGRALQRLPRRKGLARWQCMTTTT